MGLKRDFASYRDPSGHVYNFNERIIRTVTGHAKEEYEYICTNKTLKNLQDKGWVIPAKEIDINEITGNFPDVIKKDIFYVLEHPKIPFISYPYEWSFNLLKSAALRHLSIQIELLEDNISLSDASAYNIQFVNGVNPVFIDYLSFKRYSPGEYWIGHKQFCEHFLNPLILRAYLGIPHNAWYRGNLEGIPTSDIRKMMPLHRKLSFKMLTNIVLPDKFQASTSNPDNSNLDKLKEKKLPKAGYAGMLNQLYTWISKLTPRDKSSSTWSEYTTTHTYSNEEEEKKHQFIREFIAATDAKIVVDMGCNTGEYSETALASGANTVIGFDFDQGALDMAYERAKDKKLDFLPLFLDAANPSPGQGWNQKERPGCLDRLNADAVIALAFEHHLSIAKNISLDEVVNWIVNIAPKGIIEFIQKDDPTIQIMLTIREDIFHDYCEETFIQALEKKAKIIKKLKVSDTNRILYWFERNNN